MYVCVCDVRQSGRLRWILSSQANDSGCCPLSCTDRRSTCPWVDRKSQVRQLEGKGRRRKVGDGGKAEDI